MSKALLVIVVLGWAFDRYMLLRLVKGVRKEAYLRALADISQAMGGEFTMTWRDQLAIVIRNLAMTAMNGAKPEEVRTKVVGK